MRGTYCIDKRIGYLALFTILLMILIVFSLMINSQKVTQNSRAAMRKIPVLVATNAPTSIPTSIPKDPGFFGGYVEFGGDSIPIRKFDDNECPTYSDAIRDFEIIFCDKSLRTNDKIQPSGQIFAGHNVSYTKPWSDMSAISSYDPGGLAMKNQGKCVKFGNEYLFINSFFEENAIDAWSNNLAPRFITSFDEINAKVYMSFLTPCRVPNSVGGITPIPKPTHTPTPSKRPSRWDFWERE